MVDAKHADLQLDEHHEAQGRVAFADRILITKTDLETSQELSRLRKRLIQMNPHAKVAISQHGQTTIDDLLVARASLMDSDKLPITS
jgi:G3E family GTPase